MRPLPLPEYEPGRFGPLRRGQRLISFRPSHRAVRRPPGRSLSSCRTCAMPDPPRSAYLGTLPTCIQLTRRASVRLDWSSPAMQLEKIQQELRNQNLDGWLFFDHHLRDPLAYRVLDLKPAATPTRRWYYLIPSEGEPRGLEHRIERGMIRPLPGRKIPYSSWTEQVEGLRQITAGLHRVAMQYSPDCAIPYVSMVDAGTIELIRSIGIEVVSSAELIQYFEARWSPEALESHLEAGRRVDRVRAAAFAMVRERTLNGAPLQEVEMKEFVRGAFTEAGLITDHGPIVGVNANASNPHYEPTAALTSPIRKGDLVLLDLWAKLDRPGSVYYDITWTYFCSD